VIEPTTSRAAVAVEAKAKRDRFFTVFLAVRRWMDG
jgi:hypothetical protein